jgi:phospholipase C
MHQCVAKTVAFVASAALMLAPWTPTYADDRDDSPTKTPIKYVAVIFHENVSFDHYFGTYPHAFNLPGETPFHAKEDTLSMSDNSWGTTFGPSTPGALNLIAGSTFPATLFSTRANG